MHKSWEGKCSFLDLVLICCGERPSCLLAAFDIGSCDLADLLCNIYIRDCKLLDNGGIAIDHQALVQVCSLFFCLMKQVFYFLYKLLS